jgi:Fe-S cluster assembly protein SufD
MTSTDTWRDTHPAWTQGTPDASRAEALARFATHGFPGPKTEAWKYTSLRKLIGLPFVHDEGEAAVEDAVASVRFEADLEVVLVNGVLRGALELPEGLASEASLPTPAAEYLALLNDAFHQDGLHIRALRGSDLTVHVVHVAVGGDAPVVSHPRHRVVVETNARLTLVQTHLQVGEQATLTNEVLDLDVQPGGDLRHVVVSPPTDTTHRVLTTRARLDRDARYHHHITLLGGALLRNEITVDLDAPGAEAVLDGVYVLGGRDHADNHTELRHNAPHCTSRELYKGVLGGRAKGVFDGQILVAKDAQKTDAAQENRNLLLSATADANAKPRLEIYADDVKCAHGTTVGQLDRRQLAYLRMRGIPKDDAVRMLTSAFVADVVDRLPVDGLREQVGKQVAERLAAVWEQA